MAEPGAAQTGSPARNGSPPEDAPQATAELLQALQEEVKQTVDSALEQKGVISVSPHQRTGGGYQTVRFRDSQRGGFRSARPNLLSGLAIEGRSVCDLGANLGEISRDLRRAGADRVDAYEYDHFFTQLARYITAYNGLSDVNHHQVDVSAPGFLRGEYDLGVGLSAYSFMHENIDYICGQIAESLIIETHEISDSSWHEHYVEPISRHFPYWCCFGKVAHGRAGSSKRRLWLAFFRSQRTGFAFYGRRAAELRPDGEGVIEVDLERSRLNLLNQSELLDGSNLILERRSQPLSQQSRRLFADRLDEYERRLATDEYVNLSLSGEPYWLALLLGLGELEDRGSFDQANTYWKWMTRGVEAGLVDPGLKPLLQDPGRLQEKMALRLSALGQALRSRDTSSFGDIPIAYNATPDHPAFENLHLKTLALDGSDELLCVPRLNGHHRLFVMRLLDVKSCPMMTIWDPQFLGDPPSLTRIENYERRMYQYLAGGDFEDPILVDDAGESEPPRGPLLAEDLEPRRVSNARTDASGRENAPLPVERNGGRSAADPPAPGSVIRLVRGLDSKAWRHTYAIGVPPSNEIDAPLGALRAKSGPGHGVGIWLTEDGRVVTSSYAAVSERPSLRQLGRWIFAPLVWGRPPSIFSRLRLVDRRFARAFRRPWRRLGSEPARADSPVGYLDREPRPGRVPLYSAVHPVAGDQLVTTSEVELDELGYLKRRRLGFISSKPLVTDPPRTPQPIPWAGPGGVRRVGEELDAAAVLAGRLPVAAEKQRVGAGTPALIGRRKQTPVGGQTVAAKGDDAGRAAGAPTQGAVIGVVRAVDQSSWRHTYAIGDQPSGTIDGPLGAVRATVPAGQGIGVWIAADGRVATLAHRAVCDRPPLRRIVRWIFAPLVWGGPPSLPRRGALVARRFAHAVPRPWTRFGSAPQLSGQPIGYLHRNPGPGRKRLYSALHPVAGDQLVTTSQEEIEELGYLMPKRLGFIVSAASVDRAPGTGRQPIRWASRKGLRRAAEQPRLNQGALTKPDSSVPAPVDGVHVAGWAVLEDEAVARAEILLNGESAGLARLGIQRLGKGPADAPEWPVSGFDRRVPPANLPPSGSQVLVEVLVTGVDGTELLLCAPAPLRLEAPGAPLEFPPDSAAATSISGSPTSNGRRATREHGLRVLAFTHRLNVGGAQRYLVEQLLRLARSKGTRCTVIASADGEWRETLEQSGVEAIVGTEFPLSSRESYEAKIDEIAGWASSRSFDVVYANTFDAFLGVDVADRLGLPSLWAIHESFDLATWWAMQQRDDPEAYVRSRSLHALRSANALLFAADATKPFYRDYVDPQRMLTAPYALDLRRIDRFIRARKRDELRRRLGLDDETTLVMCLAVIEPRKGQSVLARAWAQICEQHPNAHLALVGEIDSRYCQGLRRYVESTGLADRCTIMPVTMNPYEWHHAADIYVLASEVESSPISVLEAMAFETVAVCSDVFGVPELIMHGQEGFMFRPNDVGDLASILDRVLRLPREERRRVAEAGARRVRERHDPDHYHRLLSAALHQLAADPEAVPRWEARA